MTPILVSVPPPPPPSTIAARLVDELVGTGSSVHRSLRPMLAQAQAGHRGALSPGPRVDRALSRLVGLVTRCHGPAGQPSPRCRNRVHLEVVSEVGRQLAADPMLAERAADIRIAAALAEVELELHHASAALSHPWPAALPALPRQSPAAAAPDPGWAADWLLAPLPALNDQRALRLTMLRLLLASFPYLANYELLTAGELAAITAVAQADTRTDERPVAFCGAGALPLSGIILHVLTDTTVELLEVDPDAAALAAELRDRLIAAGVVRPGGLAVHRADAAMVDATRYAAVITASLLPETAVRAVMGAVATVPAKRGRPVLAVRSAAGLAAWFCYEPTPLAWGLTAGLQHRGSVVPLTSISLDPDPPRTTGATALHSPNLLAAAPAEVLNCTELFT